GANFDSHQVISEIAAKGAAAVIVERDMMIDENLTVIRVNDTRKALAHMSAAYFGHPARKMRMIAVTGTKGKTTTTYLIKSILENAGYQVGLIGTIETIIGEDHIKATNTTPESYVLQSYLKQMLDCGCQVVIMEASSQGFKLARTDAIMFDYGIFTNIEPDHIGPNEHADFLEYLQCKSMLFKQCETGIVNGDDPHVERIIQGHTCRIERYGIVNPADLLAKDIELVSELDYLGVAFRTEGMIELEVTVDTPGMFSVYNALAAIAVCSHFNIDRNDIVRALREAKVKGRIEMISVSNEFSLMIDYAHNAMALESLLKTLKEYNPQRIVTLFGCGGNRSKMRRYEMGEVSGRLSDLTIITSDNPRDEDPMDIIADIRTGIQKTNGEYLEICDRREAIAYAIANARPGDVIILAGKGHEDYQEIKGVKYPMDEREIIKNITLQSDF
ncbi:MAG: UDP-N-acetylmuramoyl-L-alanyl-D-glutamate--2,6-diaminopimelate ligase, partial [Clostridia bacterium]|nr:UDP-N-acetylmuramoyl-L-alanyl-D-glutamate--2,6-diaminopimelate ligase [Clostridia bacterium]